VIAAAILETDRGGFSFMRGIARMFGKKKARLPVFMLLGQGGHRKDGTEVDDERAYIVFVPAASMDDARQAAIAALEDRNWHGVHLLRGGEVAERPPQEPHGTAWLEASEGRRGVIVYTTAQAGGPEEQGSSS
jgi:hypothetical protein